MERFFSDVAHEVPILKQEINLFADDLTVMTSRKQHVSDRLLLNELEAIQSRTHAWGVRNQVEFDPGKEYVKILHPSLGLGEEFKLLGTLFDVALSMTSCIDAILATQDLRTPQIEGYVQRGHDARTI